MHTSANAVPLRTVEDLADARELREAISTALAHSPMNDQDLRCAVWSFVGLERRGGVPPAVVIGRLTALIDDSPARPSVDRSALTRRVILWCVEEYFGHFGGNVLASDPPHAVPEPSFHA